MKTLGIIGGLGPEATLEYYYLINEKYYERHHSYPELLIYSMDMMNFLKMAGAEEWDRMTELLTGAVTSLHRAGADVALIASNTPHIVLDDVDANAPIPLISIVEETLKTAEKHHLENVGLLGTKFTMRADVYQKAFSRKNIKITTPNKDEQEYIHTKLVEEIGMGEIVEDTQQELLSIIKRMIDDDSIDGVVLGCTELPLILTKNEFGIPFLNTTEIHTDSALDIMEE